MKLNAGTELQARYTALEPMVSSVTFSAKAHPLQTMPTSVLSPVCHLLLISTVTDLTRPLSENVLMIEETVS